MKKIYLLAGFGEDETELAYKELGNFAQKNGFSVVFVPIRWERSTISKWIQTFEQLLEKDTDNDSIVIGFSFGAMIASIVAQKHQFKKLILCSLSPYFSEDIAHIPNQALRWLGKNRVKDFKKYHFKPLKTPAVFLVGQNEWVYAKKQIRKRFSAWKGPKELVEIAEVGHDLSETNYLDEIKKILKET